MSGFVGFNAVGGSHPITSRPTLAAEETILAFAGMTALGGSVFRRIDFIPNGLAVDSLPHESAERNSWMGSAAMTWRGCWVGIGRRWCDIWLNVAA